MKSKILTFIGTSTLFVILTISCFAKDSSKPGIKVMVFEPSRSEATMEHTAQLAWFGSLKTKLMALDSVQENRLVDGINKLISMADNISVGTNTHKVDRIELNIGVDANADAVLVNVGSNESIKVILSNK